MAYASDDMSGMFGTWDSYETWHVDMGFDVEIKEGGVSKTVKQWVGKGNATERALVVGARKLGLER
eukprot:675991-Amorphochlora_amoeboformis.AAC.1